MSFQYIFSLFISLEFISKILFIYFWLCFDIIKNLLKAFMRSWKYFHSSWSFLVLSELIRSATIGFKTFLQAQGKFHTKVFCMVENSIFTKHNSGSNFGSCILEIWLYFWALIKVTNSSHSAYKSIHKSSTKEVKRSLPSIRSHIQIYLTKFQPEIDTALLKLQLRTQSIIKSHFEN